MKFSIKTDLPEKQRSDVLVLGVYDSLKVAYDKPIAANVSVLKEMTIPRAAKARTSSRNPRMTAIATTIAKISR